MLCFVWRPWPELTFGDDRGKSLWGLWQLLPPERLGMGVYRALEKVRGDGGDIHFEGGGSNFLFRKDLEACG